MMALKTSVARYRRLRKRIGKPTEPGSSAKTRLWTPLMAELGETRDPQQLVPGKPEAIEANVRVLDARGRQAVDAATGLRAIDTGAWRGPAADAFMTSSPTSRASGMTRVMR